MTTASDDARTIVIIGIGNPWRRDDGVGRHVIRHLRDAATLPGDARILELDTAAGGLVDELAGADLAIIIDAARSTQHPPGTIHRVDAHTQPLPTAFTGSTHAFGLANAIEMARALNALPPRLLVIGIEIASLDHGNDLSPQVAAAVPDVTRAIAKEVAAPGGADVSSARHRANVPSPNERARCRLPLARPSRIPTMHEMSLLAGIMKQIDRIATEAKAKRVLTVRVTLGALAHISPDHFREHFVEAAAGTVAEGAELIVTQATDESDPNAQEIILNSVDVDDE